MPIIHETAPYGTEDLLSQGMATLTQLVEQTEERSIAVANLQLTAPHPIYTLDHSHVDQADLLADAHRIGWRWLVVEDNEAIGSIVVSETDGGLALGAVGTGRLVPAFVEAVTAAEAMPEVAEQDYQLRYIEAKPLYFAALWLVPVDSGAPVLIPLEDRTHAAIQAHAATDQKILHDALKAELPGLLAFPHPD